MQPFAAIRLAIPNPSADLAGLAGHEVLLRADGSAYLPDLEALLVSDLHLEKASAFAVRGRFVPPYDTAITLGRLDQALRETGARRVIALGDTFHDATAGGRMLAADQARLSSLLARADWFFLLGNHDPALPAFVTAPSGPMFALGALMLVHIPGERPDWSVAGHLHPCAAVRQGQVRLRRRCFVADSHRLILPAFGAFTGGLNVCDPAFSAVFPAAPVAYLCGDGAVIAVPPARLEPDGGARVVPVLKERRRALTARRAS